VEPVDEPAERCLDVTVTVLKKPGLIDVRSAIAVGEVRDAVNQLSFTTDEDPPNTVLFSHETWDHIIELTRRWQRRRFVLLGVLLGILGALLCR
jgi:hypothetical protein